MSLDDLTKRAMVSAAAAALAGCSGGGESSPSASTDGTLSVALIDTPFTEAAEINLGITQVNVKPADGPPIEFPLDPDDALTDLLALDADSAKTLLEGESVPAGDYDWIELEVDAEFDESVEDSHVVTRSGGVFELRVPSDSVRLVSGFTVTANQETRFTIDWDTRRGLVKPPGLPGFLLRPAFRIIDMTDFGTLSGTIEAQTILEDPVEGTPDQACNADDPDYDVGNAVYVYEGHDALISDIAGDEEDPVATIDVRPGPDGPYVYEAILSPGEYTVTFTCQGGNDDAETDEPQEDEPATDGEALVLFTAPVNIEILVGEDTRVDF